MQLSGLWGRAMGAARETVSTAKEQAQERLVVLNSRTWDVSLKWALASLLAAFLLGLWQGYGWGGKAMTRFQAAAAKLEMQHQAEIKALNDQLDVLRSAFLDQEKERGPRDKKFEEALAAAKKATPVANECRVPVAPLNDLIAEANK